MFVDFCDQSSILYDPINLGDLFSPQKVKVLTLIGEFSAIRIFKDLLIRVKCWKLGNFHVGSVIQIMNLESIPYNNGSNGLQIGFKILRTYSYKMRLFPVEKEGSNN